MVVSVVHNHQFFLELLGDKKNLTPHLPQNQYVIPFRVDKDSIFQVLKYVLGSRF